jgi:hypothetical protein
MLPSPSVLNESSNQQLSGNCRTDSARIPPIPLGTGFERRPCFPLYISASHEMILRRQFSLKKAEASSPPQTQCTLVHPPASPRRTSVSIKFSRTTLSVAWTHTLYLPGNNAVWLPKFRIRSTSLLPARRYGPGTCALAVAWVLCCSTRTYSARDWIDYDRESRFRLMLDIE